MEFKISKFVHVFEQKEYIALYNYLNSKLIIVSLPEEKVLLKNFLITGTLYDNHIFDCLKSYDMIVDNTVDEDLLLNYLMNNYLYHNKRLEITVIPGQSCNFRCAYCYEEKNTAVITNEILEGTAYFIQRMVEEYSYKEVNIAWFGGEPTLYSQLILNFMYDLKHLLPNIKVSGCMTTNGYLLNAESFLSYYKAGIDTYQITLDCFKETHDMLRKHKNGTGTWNTVNQNLLNISKLTENFSILLRINYNEYMLHEIFDFINYIKQTFDKRFLVHTHPIFNNDENSAFNDIMCDPYIEHYARISIIDHMVDNEVINDLPILLTSFASHICYAAKPNCFVIDEKGIIRKCTVALDKEYNNVGHIIDSHNYTIDQYRLSKWTESRLDSPNCHMCECLPACNRTTGCPKIFFGSSPHCRDNNFYANYYIDKLVAHIFSQKTNSERNLTV